MQKRLAITLAWFASVMIASSVLPTAGRAATQSVAVTTYHYDPLRTGWNQNETTLTATNFPSNFGILQTIPLDDQVDAQPLEFPNLTINGVFYPEVVYVATESNTVYAINPNATDPTKSIILSRSVGTPVPSNSGCGIGPNVGIMGTPVIDPATQTLYVIAYVNGANGSPPTYQLHALSLTTLGDKIPGSPVTVAATHTLTHTLTNGSTYTFDAGYQLQRPGLLELDGTIYAAFGSFCDWFAKPCGRSPALPGRQQ